MGLQGLPILFHSCWDDFHLLFQKKLIPSNLKIESTNTKTQVILKFLHEDESNMMQIQIPADLLLRNSCPWLLLCGQKQYRRFLNDTYLRYRTYNKVRLPIQLYHSVYQ